MARHILLRHYLLSDEYLCIFLYNKYNKLHCEGVECLYWKKISTVETLKKLVDQGQRCRRREDIPEGH